MIHPDAVQREAALREKENARFRRFLKAYADENDLDQKINALHHTLFAHYDCTQCRNCCRAYDVTVQPHEAAAITEKKGMTKEAFCNMYLAESPYGYEIKNPCSFLRKGGICEIEDCKPAECIGYPYTDKPGRMSRLLNLVESASVCPVVFEMLEHLKDEYGFRRCRR